MDLYFYLDGGGETLAFVMDVANEDGDGLRERVYPTYIARWGKPQLSDQTDLKQWLRCVVEVGRRPPREADLTWRWAQAGRPDMWGRPAPPVSLRAPASFPCLLVSSRTFLSISAEFDFLDSYSFSAYFIFTPENS
jgi:hypothetical protein